ncbi:hypothetical protein [Aquimarina aquimarini]|uniref:hypothetical protein n=1 Tax=Aquimarina aquimarini TaxID=1191734 RepID=UPI000D5555C6|nr:hypothetical protein [Aquimarina aquimarini]
MKYILQISVLLLFFSCKSDDPIENPSSDSYTLQDQTITVNQSETKVIVLGNEKNASGNTLTYTVSPDTHTAFTTEKNKIEYTSDQLGIESLNISATDGENTEITAKITVNVIDPKGEITSNYITSREIIQPDLGTAPPTKGESRIDPVTGVKITRLTDASEFSNSNDALIVYSRYTPENSDGTLFIVHGANSTTSWILERESGNIVTELKNATGRSIGEDNEIRWDISGNHPYRVYFRYDMALYMIDDVRNQEGTRTLIKDFSADIPNATKLYNDVEGDSSNDSDHWAWMAVHYDGRTNVVDAFIHYQISTNTTHIFKPSDLAGTNLDHHKNDATFPRPNMVEISPTGSGVVLHYGRSWGDASYGVRPEDIGSWFDGPHLWPLDFNHTAKSPVKISISESHSGWSFGENGEELFISQNNRTDWLDAISTISGYDSKIEIASHKDFGWSCGFHYGKMPNNKKGWVFVNTYSNINEATHDTDWAADQLFMIQIKPSSSEPIVWRIGHNYNNYSGDYRDEAPAAINLLGNRIYLSNNWGGQLDHREVFLYELPNNWNEVLKK